MQNRKELERLIDKNTSATTEIRAELRILTRHTRASLDSIEVRTWRIKRLILENPDDNPSEGSPPHEP